MLSLSLGFANAANKRNRLASFIKNIQTATVIGFMTGSAKSVKRRRTRRSTEAMNGVIRVADQKKPSVWDLTCMPRGLSVEETVNLSNEAAPLLDNQYWKAGEAQKIYKQFGRKWDYLWNSRYFWFAYRLRCWRLALSNGSLRKYATKMMIGVGIGRINPDWANSRGGGKGECSFPALPDKHQPILENLSESASIKQGSESVQALRFSRGRKSRF